ncbi:bifunctional 4-hydroxy-3-methylbut-2-enyl diphosphate reductase/30S ribosomal protein S1 [Christensenella minuta]|uniref:bifunctional 4-hydroxy-3-methylbut-2-enyl diphosphate reductase/30S ribosomal protein S1 n=1 Tax=Christensenella minuta TaxID=626937 RepID=UPI002A7EF3F6|nr:bifunctional 4-hydroxy-3-methylbut-2-enyl diphosphate reductase/30S ribosomal protein S1 [Christensenella minuta]MDY3752301.1 bifunctional 4-hydroxy-3-methylbut-2-enyl diphosphate reductase/30S ribosomal protein S1 [Christensenella minuta]
MSRIVVAKNAGFCFGVARAVDTVNETVGKFDHIYTYGELIHNKDVIADLEKKGIRVTEDLDAVPRDQSTVIVIRSHGVSKAVYDKIRERGFDVLDLTCPFVARIHKRVIEAGDTPVVIIGTENHPEVAGIKGWAQGEVYVAGSAEEAKKLPRLEHALVVAQTTITHKLWDEVVEVLNERSETLDLFNSICDTTQKRQKEAVELAQVSDIVLVVGGRHSSNTEKLYQLCKSHCEKTYYIDNIAQLPLEKVTNHVIISIVAGASTPDWLIREVKTLMSDVEKVVDTTQDTEEQEVVSTEQEQSQAHEDFRAEIEKSFVYIKRGQIVTGTVVQISDSEICVNIGYKSDGIIKKENLTAAGDENPMDLFKVGDEIEAEVVTLNDGEGNVVLSRKSIESKLKWKELVESLDESAVYTVKVDKVVKGGVLAKLDGYDAFIPASQLSLRYVEDLSEFVGQDLEVNIIEADKRQRRFVLSHKNILKAQAEEQEKKLYDTFKKGDKVTGKVKRLTDFGAFVDIGGVDGLLHITDISWVKIKHPSDVLKVGDDIEVQILNVDPEKKRISLGLKQLSPKPWDLVPEKYLVGDTVEGTVVRIMPFGAFVSLEPTIDGLVHISQVTNRRLEKVEEELRIGDKVTAKIMEVNPAKKRISLSIRALMDEPEKPVKQETDSKQKEERFHYEIPPVEEATSSLADFFPKMDTDDSQDEE